MKVDISHEKIEELTSDILQDLKLHKNGKAKTIDELRLMVIEAHRVTEQEHEHGKSKCKN